MKRILSRMRLILAAAMALPLVVAATPASAQTGERCFPETGQCISGRFREYWEGNGGLQVFGFPITAPAEEFNVDLGRTRLTQWFERERFELHPENARPYDVLLGRLGADRLRETGIDWQAEPEGTQQDGCFVCGSHKRSMPCAIKRRGSASAPTG